MFVLLSGVPVAQAVDPLNAKPFRFKGPEGQVLPFQNDAEILDFLRSARVVSSKRVGRGINNPRKVLLEKDGVRAHAVFRDVKIERLQKVGPVFDLVRDDALFEVAAFELSRLLGIDAVLPTVKRELFGCTGSLQLWLEGATSETKRVREHLTPPDRRVFRLQNQIMLLFDALIYNDDRNQGNILFDSDWKLWMIDHTRGFQRRPYLFPSVEIWFCDSEVWEKLRALDRETLRARIGEFLQPRELSGLLHRRDQLVKRIRKLIAKRGTQLVLFNLDSEFAKSTGGELGKMR